MVELRELSAALRRANEGLREAHHALALVVIRHSLHGRFRRRPTEPQRPDQDSAASVVQPDTAGELQARCRSHLANIRLLQEENHQLSEDVAEWINRPHAGNGSRS